MLEVLSSQEHRRKSLKSRYTLLPSSLNCTANAKAQGHTAVCMSAHRSFQHCDTLQLWQQQQMHNSIICVFFLLFSYYMFRHCRHLHGVYTKKIIQTYSNEWFTIKNDFN
jgi:hypothetical protein